MMKLMVFISILLVCNVGFSQDLVVVAKVQGDSISIKWLPTNFDQYKAFARGVVVSRKESDAISNFESIDFTDGKFSFYPPLNSRYNSLTEKLLSTHKKLTGDDIDVPAYMAKVIGESYVPK